MPALHHPLTNIRGAQRHYQSLRQGPSHEGLQGHSQLPHADALSAPADTRRRLPQINPHTLAAPSLSLSCRGIRVCHHQPSLTTLICFFLLQVVHCPPACVCWRRFAGFENSEQNKLHQRKYFLLRAGVLYILWVSYVRGSFCTLLQVMGVRASIHLCLNSQSAQKWAIKGVCWLVHVQQCCLVF